MTLPHYKIGILYGLAAQRGTVINDLKKRIKEKYECEVGNLTDEQYNEILKAYGICPATQTPSTDSIQNDVDT
jgi:hypothetical protein